MTLQKIIEAPAPTDVPGKGQAAIFRGLTTDIDHALSTASIYALPSREEGFPVAAMEAMVYGLPRVAFNCAPGILELIADEVSGLLVNPRRRVRLRERPGKADQGP